MPSCFSSFLLFSPHHPFPAPPPTSHLLSWISLVLALALRVPIMACSGWHSALLLGCQCPCPVSLAGLHYVCVMSPVCHVVVPSVSQESPSASESGVLLSQDPSAKPVLFLPPKKPAAFSGDHEETPVKQLSLLKQPPALPPKPTARIANHLTGKSNLFRGAQPPPSLHGIVSFSLVLFI